MTKSQFIKDKTKPNKNSDEQLKKDLRIYRNKCPKCGNDELDKDFLWHDRDLYDFGIHVIVCHKCEWNDMIKETDPNVRAKWDSANGYREFWRN